MVWSSWLGCVNFSDPCLLQCPQHRGDGSATFDFSGTGPEVYGNLNAPPAVAYSAVIYSLRCLVTRDIPLNQGCLAPIKVAHLAERPVQQQLSLSTCFDNLHCLLLQQQAPVLQLHF